MLHVGRRCVAPSLRSVLFPAMRRPLSTLDPKPQAQTWQLSEDAQRSMQELPSSSSSTVWLAFVGNGVITALKATMWLRTGSSAMLAETLHTLVDTANQAFLILGLTQSRSAPDVQHQYGYGRAAFFWGLVSALGLFWCGAGVSVIHGVDKLLHPPEALVVGWDTWAVLGSSLAIDGFVLTRATKEILARVPADSVGEGWLGKPRAIFQHIRVTQDPFIAAVFLEDSAATLGVLIAAAGIGLTQVTGMVVFDTLASLSIGGMLGYVAFRLASLNKKFLLGHSVDDDTVADITAIIERRPSIDHISEVQSQWIGPTTFAYKAEVDFDGTYLAASLHGTYEALFRKSKDLDAELPLLLSMYAEDVTRLVEKELQDVEASIRAKHPGAAFIELEPDSKDTDTPMSEMAANQSFRSTEVAEVRAMILRRLKRQDGEEK